ncbi:hypothetical protein HAX54_039283, partial [Datura stramonium]|nr:hypothetical protein [Datura stramonium]
MGNFIRLQRRVLCGDLSVFCDYERIHANIWVKKQYGVKQSWTKMFTIKYYDNLGHLLLLEIGFDDMINLLENQ